MTNTAALDQAVREVTTPLDRWGFAGTGHLFPREVFCAAIRRRYREIVEERGSN